MSQLFKIAANNFVKNHSVKFSSVIRSSSHN